MTVKIDHLATETRNEASMDLDTKSALEVVTIMNREDQKVALAIEKKLPVIAKAVELIRETLKNGGRMIYFGAGTSGRLGVLDASECPPTFSTTTEVTAVMAGGSTAILRAAEGAEDSEELGEADLKSENLSSKDVCVGIAASGRTPYVIGGLKYAHSIGAKSITVSCNEDSAIGKYADIAIDVSPGPEVLTGSTRLKAGTTQKMILNMLTTASMVGLGKVYKNLMVDVNPTNLKLIERAKHIIMSAVEVDYDTAAKALEACHNKVKPAILVAKLGCSYEEALKRLKDADGFVRKALLG